MNNWYLYSKLSSFNKVFSIQYYDFTGYRLSTHNIYDKVFFSYAYLGINRRQFTNIINAHKMLLIGYKNKIKS